MYLRQDFLFQGKNYGYGQHAGGGMADAADVTHSEEPLVPLAQGSTDGLRCVQLDPLRANWLVQLSL